MSVQDDENEDYKTPKYMKLPVLKFLLQKKGHDVCTEMKKTYVHEFMSIIRAYNMAPYFEKSCRDLDWPIEETLLNIFKNNNSVELSNIEHSEVDEETYGCPGTWMKRLLYLISIGDFEKSSILADEKFKDVNLTTNCRLECGFSLFRIAYLQDCDIKKMHAAIVKLQTFIESNDYKVDWSGRNKMKVYEGIYCVAIRNYKGAADNLNDCISTFESYELTDFSTIVKYTIISSMVALPRGEIKKKLVSNGVVLQILYTQPVFREFVLSLDECRYADFFVSLAEVETELKSDPLTCPYYHRYIRDMRIKAYGQVLISYLTLSVERMAEIFGVTEEFIEAEISRFIASGNLFCRIDKVAGKILTANGGLSVQRAMAYQNIVRKGDFIINNVKRLSRIVDV